LTSSGVGPAEGGGDGDGDNGGEGDWEGVGEGDGTGEGEGEEGAGDEGDGRVQCVDGQSLLMHQSSMPCTFSQSFRGWQGPSALGEGEGEGAGEGDEGEGNVGDEGDEGEGDDGAPPQTPPRPPVLGAVHAQSFSSKPLAHGGPENQ